MDFISRCVEGLGWLTIGAIGPVVWWLLVDSDSEDDREAEREDDREAEPAQPTKSE